MLYEPLDSERSEIRLLHLLRKGETPLSLNDTLPPNVLQCTLKKVSLQDVTPVYQDFLAAALESGKSVGQWMKYAKEISPASSNIGRFSFGDFHALSYTWGTSTNSKAILLNGESVHINENLELFLRQVASEDLYSDKIGLWVDAICINQADIPERNSHVKQMAEIYEQALTVVSWLGVEADDSQKAIELLQILGPLNDAHNPETSLQKLMDFVENMRQPEGGFEKGAWWSLFQLLSRPYFRRLWIIQEIVLGRGHLQVRCGDQMISWDDVSHAAAFLSRYLSIVICRVSWDVEDGSSPDNSDNIANSITRILILSEYGRSSTPESLLSAVRASEQKDERDKVYGILSLLNPAVAKNITPNYDLTKREVYKDFAAVVINSTRDLDIICQSIADPAQTNWPSWVPDLTKTIPVIELTSKIPYTASAGMELAVEVKGDVLEVRGFQVDEVAAIGPCLLNEDDEKVVQPTKATPNPYRDEAGLREAIWRVFVADRTDDDEIAIDEYEALLDEWESQEAMNKQSSTDNALLFIFRGIVMDNAELVIGGKALKNYFPVARGNSKIKMALQSTLQKLQKITLTPKAKLFKMVRMKLGDIQEQAAGRLEDPFRSAVSRAAKLMFDRRLLVTTKGYFGVGVKTASPGDAVCIIFGCSTPVVLRKQENGQYRVLGEAFIHGFMKGEAVEGLNNGEYEVTDFVIS